MSLIRPALRRVAVTGLAAAVALPALAVPTTAIADDAVAHAAPALPRAMWDSLTASGANLSVSGWAFDPDDVSASVPVHVYVDGHGMPPVTANDSRPDVGAAFGVGNDHGFGWSATVAPGDHQVCLYAIDTDDSRRNTALGCRTGSTQMALPGANWEGLSAAGPKLGGIGWAVDRDSPNEAVSVHVYVDGRGLPVVTANGSRPDVGAAFGLGSNHGFSWSTTVAPGSHTVCLYAIDVQFASRNNPLGCRTISTQVALPRANWDALSASGSTISVSGWTFDPDDVGASVPVHVYVDGQGAPVTANAARPDVGAAFGVGDDHGFAWSTTVAPGDHQVCLYAIDTDDSRRNTSLGCRTASTQTALPRGNWEDQSAMGPGLSGIGWAVDSDSPGSAVPVRVYVDGQDIPVVTANGWRPDVGAAFGLGDQHGFAWSTTVAPGDHRVCLAAIDVQFPARTAPLGCRTITTQLALPRANWDSLSASASTLSVAGWAYDPDDTGRAVPVHAYVDGQGTPLTANVSRPDVGAAFGVGNDHGFAWSATTAAGDHRVCLYAIDPDLPSRSTSLGCREITVPSGTPSQAIEAAWTATGGASGLLGASVGGVQGGLVRNGYRQDFEHGAIYWTATTGARAVLSGPVRDGWLVRDEESGVLGYPTGEMVCGLLSSGCVHDFEGGSLYFRGFSGMTAYITGPIRSSWQAAGAENGALGYPVSDPLCGRTAGGCTQAFDNGYYAWSSASGAHSVDHQVWRVWQRYAAQAGSLGYPTQDSALVGANLVYVRFQHGDMYVSCRDPQQPCTDQVAFD